MALIHVNDCHHSSSVLARHPFPRSTWLIVTRGLLLVIATLAAACGGPSAAARGPASEGDAQSVRVLRVQATPLDRSVNVTGTLAAEEQVMLSLKVTGRLEELLV